MAKRKQPSRFHPAYLAARHGGMLFFFLALGLACGLLWRALALPTRYYAETGVDIDVDPPTAAEEYPWIDAIGRWSDLLTERRERRLVSCNLRYALKRAVTADSRLDTESLAAELSFFTPEREYSTILFSALPGGLGAGMKLTLRDIAAHMDFQALAAIVSDLDAPDDAAKWDFSFYHESAPGDSFLIVQPGKEDRHFAVFHHLHAIRNQGEEAISPEQAWRTAATVVHERLVREAQFSGGGGFGHLARRELVREFAAIPALAANGLYDAAGLSFGDGDFRWQTELWDTRWKDQVTLVPARQSQYDGRVGAAMEMLLNPVAFPRDTTLTRIPPLALQVLLAHLAAKEAAATPIGIPAPAPKPPPQPAPPDPQPETEPKQEPEAPVVTIKPRPAPDQTARIRDLEGDLLPLRAEHHTAILRLETARAREKTLAGDALAARERAARIRTEYDELERLAKAAEAAARTPTPEMEKLLASRSEILARLAELLQYCTEEHPFVKQARRELRAVDTLLATLRAKKATDAQREARTARLETLRGEWEIEQAAAADLEARRTAVAETVAEIEKFVAGLEARISATEYELARIRAGRILGELDSPKKDTAIASVPKQPENEPAPAPVSAPVSAPVPTPAAVPAPVPAPAPDSARVVFGPIPTRIPLYSYPPGWSDVIAGLVFGLVLGLCAAIVKEALSTRFHSAAEARRLLGIPVLAALPAYEAKSVRAAAATMTGDVVNAPGHRLTFIPAPVEFSEPPAAIKRGAVRPVKRRRSILPWVLGAAILILAGVIHHRAADGLAKPAFSKALELPATAFPGAGAPAPDWGDMP